MTPVKCIEVHACAIVSSFTAGLTGEEVVVVLSQFEGAIVELPGALPRLGAEAGPHVLHTLLGVRVEKHYDRIPLSVVETVHCIRGDVQHCMLVLHNSKKR